MNSSDNVMTVYSEDGVILPNWGSRFTLQFLPWEQWGFYPSSRVMLLCLFCECNIAESSLMTSCLCTARVCQASDLLHLDTIWPCLYRKQYHGEESMHVLIPDIAFTDQNCITVVQEKGNQKSEGEMKICYMCDTKMSTPTGHVPNSALKQISLNQML